MERGDRQREKISATISVGALISYTDSFRGQMLCLVRKANTGKWGPPSGGITKLSSGRIETQQEALQREIQEETGMDIGSLERQPRLLGNVLVDRGCDNNYSIGVLFELEFYVDTPPPVTIANSNGELDEVRFFSFDELFEILEDPETNLYRPDINNGVIRWWLRNIWVHDSMGEPRGNDGPINEVIIKRLADDRLT